MKRSNQWFLPELDDLYSLFSYQEEVLPEPTNSLLRSATDTSAPLLSNPALTDTQSNFPQFSSSRAGSSVGLELAEENEPEKATDREDQAPGQSLATPLTSDRTARQKGRPKCGPPGRRRGITTSKRVTTRTTRPLTRSQRGSRNRVRTRSLSRILERAMTLPNIPESMSLG